MLIGGLIRHSELSEPWKHKLLWRLATPMEPKFPRMINLCLWRQDSTKFRKFKLTHYYYYYDYYDYYGIKSSSNARIGYYAVTSDRVQGTEIKWETSTTQKGASVAAFPCRIALCLSSGLNPLWISKSLCFIIPKQLNARSLLWKGTGLIKWLCAWWSRKRSTP